MKILFAVNLAEPVEATRAVEELCEKLDAELFVLHVDAPVQADMSVLDPSGYDTSLYSYSLHDPDVAEEMEQVRGSAFERFLQRSFKNPVQTMLRESGDPAATIIEDLETTGADMLVLGRKRHSFLERLVVGSVLARIMKSASVPVLLVPIPD